MTGLVLDKPEGEPVAGVIVTLVGADEPQPQQVVTDADGRYGFENVPSIGMLHRVQVGEHGPGVWTDDARAYVPVVFE